MIEAATLYIEAVAGCGEDAPPLAGPRFGGVFDGLGGAGAAPLRLADGRVVTNAYVASRVARSAAAEFFEASWAGAQGDPPQAYAYGPAKAGGEPLVGFATRLHRAVFGALDGYYERAGCPRSAVSSAVVLPTTLACAVLEERGDAVLATALWAGDSRVYALDADGLHQVSEDDQAGEADYFDNLRMDAPMSNKVNLSEPFYLSARTVVLRAPCAVICCTDGCHMYFRHPLGLELQLLRSFCTAATLDEALASLEGHYRATAQDDCSMTVHVAADGYGRFREAARRRYGEFAAFYASRPAQEARHAGCGAGEPASVSAGDVPGEVAGESAPGGARVLLTARRLVRRRGKSRPRHRVLRGRHALAVYRPLHAEPAPGRPADAGEAPHPVRDVRWEAYKPGYERFFSIPLVRTDLAGRLIR